MCQQWRRHGGNGGSGPPTSVQTPPEICANPLRIVLYIGGPMHVYCNFLLLTSKEKLFGPPTFFGLATPLCVKGKNKLEKKKQVGDFIIKTDVYL